MNIRQVRVLSIFIAATTLANIAAAQAGGAVGGIDIIIRKKPSTGNITGNSGPVSTNATINDDSTNSNSTSKVLNNSRANIKNNFPVNVTEVTDGPVTTTNTVNDSSTTSTTKTKTLNNFYADVNNPITVSGGDGPINTTSSVTDTTTISPSLTTTSDFTTGAGGVINNTKLDASITGNTVLHPGGSEPTRPIPPILPGNSVSDAAFSGATGFTVVNMNAGAASSMQNSVTINASPSSVGIR